MTSLEQSGEIFVCWGTFLKNGWKLDSATYLSSALLLAIKDFNGGIFVKPMFLYDQGIVKIIQKIDNRGILL